MGGEQGGGRQTRIHDRSAYIPPQGGRRGWSESRCVLGTGCWLCRDGPAGLALILIKTYYIIFLFLFFGFAFLFAFFISPLRRRGVSIGLRPTNPRSLQSLIQSTS